MRIRTYRRLQNVEVMIGATVGGLPPFSLPRLSHSDERLCASLIVELGNILLAQRNKQSEGGACRNLKIYNQNQTVNI